MKYIQWIGALTGVVMATHASASVIIPVSVPDRIRGAERVVVASVDDVTATFETNEFGDRVIVSHVTLRVEESMKGSPEAKLLMDLLGGTVGDLTFEVSSLPKLGRGERAVFFLTTAPNGKYVPHLRGQGILKLDSQDRVQRSSLDLQTIRGMAASAARR